MKHLATSFIVGSGLSAVVLFAPISHAEGLGGVSGWSPSTNVCGTGALLPVVIGNATNQSQTASVTVGEHLSANVQIFSSQAAAGSAQGCGRAENMTAPGYSYNVSVSPNSAVTFYVMFGGVDYNDISYSHSIAFGGLPSNTPNQGWYNLNLSLTATESFSGIQANYEGTGGTNGSNQANFNLVTCNTANSNVELTDNVLTPYSSGDTNGPSYTWNTPICAAWLPQGQMVDFQSWPTSGVTANAAQANGTTLSFAGSASFILTGSTLAIRYVGVSNDMQDGFVSLGNGINLVTASNGDWAVTGIPLLGTYGGVQLLTGGTVFAEYGYGTN